MWKWGWEGEAPIEESSAAEGSIKQCESRTPEAPTSICVDPCSRLGMGEDVRGGYRVTPPTPGSFCIWGFKLSDLVHTLGECWIIVYLEINRKINTRSQSMCLLLVGDTRRGSKATRRGGGGGGGVGWGEGCPLPNQVLFALWGFKLFVIWCIFWVYFWKVVYPKLNGKINTRSQNMCLHKVGDGQRGSKSTEWREVWKGVSPYHTTKFCILGFMISDLAHNLGEFVGILFIRK